MIRKRQQLFLIIYINKITFKVIINFKAISNFINQMIVICYKFKLVKKTLILFICIK